MHTIKSFPRGWKVLRASRFHNEGMVLCEKDDDRKADTQYVTWRVDYVGGGCYLGFYTDDRIAARHNFAQRNRDGAQEVPLDKVEICHHG